MTKQHYSLGKIVQIASIISQLAVLTACAQKTHGQSVVQDEVDRYAGKASLHVTTDLGDLLGYQDFHGQTFRGIPYAKPPVDQLRWRSPVAFGAWDGERDARWPSAQCPQQGNPFSTSGAEWEMSGSEDCLFLNVFRPTQTPAEPLPVMVWIHGGGFNSDSGNTYDAERLANDYGVIVVTLNYRLGALGMLIHPDLGHDPDGVPSGNFALQDQLLALKWVRDHIAGFGGNGGKITLFGQSSGGYGVCTLLAAPAAQGLFQGAIIQSGNCGLTDVDNRAQAEAKGRAFAAKVGCDEDNAEDCLRSLSAAKLAGASATDGITWNFSAGSTLLPKAQNASFAANHFYHVPVMIGGTHDEIRLLQLLSSYTQGGLSVAGYLANVRAKFPTKAEAVLAAYPLAAYSSPAMAWSAVLTDFGQSCPLYKFGQEIAAETATFVYEFNDPHAVSQLFLTGAIPDLGSYHSSEITYLFHKTWLVSGTYQFSPDQWVLADQMASYWTNFAKHGDPNGADLPVWSKDQVGASYIQSLAPGGAHEATAFFADHQCSFWR